MKVVSTKFVKKLGGTDFYEMRISFDNEYRVILFTIDKENFIEAEQVLLLNGFVKKSTGEYKKLFKISYNPEKAEFVGTGFRILFAHRGLFRVWVERSSKIAWSRRNQSKLCFPARHSLSFAFFTSDSWAILL